MPDPWHSWSTNPSLMWAACSTAHTHTSGFRTVLQVIPYTRYWHTQKTSSSHKTIRVLPEFVLRSQKEKCTSGSGRPCTEARAEKLKKAAMSQAFCSCCPPWGFQRCFALVLCLPSLHFSPLFLSRKWYQTQLGYENEVSIGAGRCFSLCHSKIWCMSSILTSNIYISSVPACTSDVKTD